MAQLISDSYRAQQQHLHESTTYGTMGEQYGPLIAQIINRLEVTHLLDYGAGANMSLMRGLQGKVKGRLTYQAYDPGVPDLAGDPTPAQLVACVDVLEHIEPECLDNVLDHLASLTEVVAFMSVHMGPALKTLPDGRNAHLIQESPEWWLPKIMQRFDLQTFQMSSERGFYCIAYAKPRLEAVDGTKLT